MRGLKWTRLACLVGMAALPLAAHGQVVISQIYGAGGNASATYSNDFVELYNKGSTAVNLANWAVQYGAATSTTTWLVNTIPSGTIQPGGYFLVQLASGGAVGIPLPTADAIGTTNISGSAGKLALTSNNTQLNSTGGTGCPLNGAAIVDQVGFGLTANCHEGAGNAASPSNNQTSMFRASNGCTDSNNNVADFGVDAVAPRNSASPTFTCPASTNPSGAGGSSPADVCPGTDVVLTVTVTPGQNPTSTGITVEGDTSNIGGTPNQPFFNDGTHGDAVANDNIWTRTDTVFVSPGFPTLTCTIHDAQSRTGSAALTVHVINCNPTGFLSCNPSGLCAGEDTLITCSTTPGQQPASTGITVTADLSAVGGSGSLLMFDDGTNGDAVAADGIFSYRFSPPNTVVDGSYAVHAVVSDSQGRQSVQLNSPLAVSSTCTNSSSTVVISQVYGGGGNTGATFTNDFVELFNRGTTPVDITGWSVQYASGADDTIGLGGTNRFTTLSGIILPGRYYLVQEAAGTGGTQALPTPDATGNIAMAQGRGAIALVRNSTPVLLNCASTDVADLVGYGNGTTQATQGFCHEGLFWAPTLDNTTAAIRRDNGCHDVNNNGIDFNITIPAPRNSATPVHHCTVASGCTADFNCDGDVGTDADISSFFACLSGTCPAAPCANTADFNNDGDVGTDADIASFFRVLSGGPC